MRRRPPGVIDGYHRRVTRAWPGRLVAISDLHVGYPENRAIVEALRPGSDDDWLLVAGDVAETVADIEWALATLSRRFARVSWAPGNHELWTTHRDPLPLRGAERYQHLVNLCRGLGVLTPEDPYPVVELPDGRPVAVAPLFLLYDYTWRPAGTHTFEEAMAAAYEAGVVGTDERFLHPDPYPSRQAWCAWRLARTAERLAALDPEVGTVLVNHFPLIREPTEVLHFPEFALWCGTDATEDWHRRFRALAVVYGHLHIPRTIWRDGVPFEEVSLGYPREWQRRSTPPGRLRPILPPPDPA